jgi:hypothetical protein
MTDDQYWQSMATIVSGLLATGLYTTAEPDGSVTVTEQHNGEDFKERGHRSRWESHCIIDAACLVEQIEAELAYLKKIRGSLL